MRSIRLAAIAVICALAPGLGGCGGRAGTDLTTSGTILATEVGAAAEVAGKVVAVHVQEGQRVQAGDPVATLDTEPLAIQVRQAEAALAMAEARLAEAKAGPRPEQVRQAQEQARQAAAALAGAQRNYDAIAALYQQGAASRAQFDAAATQLESARAQAAAAQAQADLVRQGATAEQIRQLEAAVAQARAALDLARLNLSRATVRAPVTGVVVRRLVEPGALLAPGATVAVIANLDDLYLKVYVPESQLHRVRLGQPVAVRVDAFPGRTFRAEVVHIADQAEFTPRNVQTKEERATTVYAVKLQLREGLGGELKPGMPADVTLPDPGGGK